MEAVSGRHLRGRIRVRDPREGEVVGEARPGNKQPDGRQGEGRTPFPFQDTTYEPTLDRNRRAEARVIRPPAIAINA